VWDPESRYARSSYREALPDPSTDLISASVVCAQIPATAIPYIIGSLLQLLQPPAWTITDPTRMAEVLGQVTDLILAIGTAGPCMFRLTADTCLLQYSLNGGATWTDVTGWADNFPLCVRSAQARVVMQSDVYPPIPEETPDGADWVYSPDP
jgi:hypothetical protein